VFLTEGQNTDEFRAESHGPTFVTKLLRVMQYVWPASRSVGVLGTNCRAGRGPGPAARRRRLGPFPAAATDFRTTQWERRRQQAPEALAAEQHSPPVSAGPCPRRSESRSDECGHLLVISSVAGLGRHTASSRINDPQLSSSFEARRQHFRCLGEFRPKAGQRSLFLRHRSSGQIQRWVLGLEKIERGVVD